MDWGKLKTFYYVALCKSFTKAGRVMGTSQSNMSTAIKGLEDSMGKPLFVRHPSGVTLTKNGQELLSIVKPFFEKMEVFQDMIEESSGVPKGDLVVSSTHGFIHSFLSPFLGNFLDQYPDINLKVFPQTTLPNFEVDGVDVAIFEKIPHRRDLIQKHLVKIHYGLYASPGYLKKFGIPQTVNDLDNHQLISSGDFSPLFHHMNWHLIYGRAEGDSRKPYCAIQSLACHLDLAQQDKGIIVAPKELPGLSKTNLIPVLPDVECPVLDSYLIYPEHMKNSKKIKAFEEFVMPIFHEMLPNKVN